MRRLRSRGLNFGTSPERIAPESLTRLVRRGGTATSRGAWRRGSLHRENACHGRDRNAAQSLTPMRDGIAARVNEILVPGFLRQSRGEIAPAPPQDFPPPSAQREAARGGRAVALNWVATSTPWPSGVGIDSLNGTSTRVPAIGTSQTSIAFCAARYLMAARPGT